MPDARDLLADLVAAARRAGADAADAILWESAQLTVGERLGRPEKLERAESADLGLRVFVGARVATVSLTGDLSQPSLAEAAARAVAMARLAPEDRYAGLADPDQLARDLPALDRVDPVEPDAAALTLRVKAAEDAARAVAGVSNSEGAEASWSRWSTTLATSTGFVGRAEATRSSISVSVIAGEGLGMERDYDWSSATHAADLDPAEEIGRRAGTRAVRRLGARKAPTGPVPVIYDPRVSGGLIRSLAGAASGSAVARGTSFLKDALGTAVFAPGVQVIDDPHLPRGLASRPFDAEGLPGARRALIADGVLSFWLTDLASARQLGAPATGHASRGPGGPPHPSASNLWLEPGPLTPAALYADVASGLYVTDLMGHGVNPVTGDYSRGAAGFWIVDGEIAYPVSEITIAGNLKDMFRHLAPANDLVRRYAVDAPTLRVDGMTVAGA